jgi:hypothetical protein
MNLKTWETVNASTIDVIPKRTSSVFHPDALEVAAAGTAPADIQPTIEGGQLGFFSLPV